MGNSVLDLHLIKFSSSLILHFSMVSSNVWNPLVAEGAVDLHTFASTE